MGNSIVYFNLLGARAQKERFGKGLNQSPLVVLSRGFVIDCDEKAWQAGVRLGDTLRQAKISSPACQAISTSQNSSAMLTEILEILSQFTPYVEPTQDCNEIFAQLSNQDVQDALAKLESHFFKGFIGISKSKLLAKAAAQWALQKPQNKKPVQFEKSSWGAVKFEKSCLVVTVHEGKERSFLASLPLKALWLAPPDVLSTLLSLGVKQVGDLHKISLYDLSRQIGDWAQLVKRWAACKDHPTIKALYPPPNISKKVEFVEPVFMDISVFETAFGELAEELSVKSLGSKIVSLSITGHFPELHLEKTLTRPVCSLNSLRSAVEIMIGKSINLIPHMVPSVTGFTLSCTNLASTFSKPLSLFYENGLKDATPVPLSLGTAIDGLETKFGENAIAWGKVNGRKPHINPEAVRRERVLSLWDPVRMAAVQHVALGTAGD